MLVCFESPATRGTTRVPRGRCLRQWATGVALGVVILQIGCGCSSSQLSHAGPWAQLEHYPAVEGERVLWVESDGSFSGHNGTRAASGTLTDQELAQVKDLTTESRLSVYRGVALDSDGLARPFYRMVIREFDSNLNERKLLDAYFSPAEVNADARQFLDYSEALIAKYQPEPEP